MNNATWVIGLGEVLWDVFVDGKYLGGAPTNFACNFAYLNKQQALPQKSKVISQVGDDELGHQAIEQISQFAVNTQDIEIGNKSTGRVDIERDQAGNASYDFLADSAWDNLSWQPHYQEVAKNCAAVCFGSLAQRSSASRAFIEQFLQSTADTCLRIFDINLRPPFYSVEVIKSSLALANVVKMNDEELELLKQWFDLPKDDVAALKALMQSFELTCVAVTRGESGAILIHGEQVSDLAGSKVKVVDTVGAGDAFTAALTQGLLLAKPLDQINRDAMAYAAQICMTAGATPAQ